jgi:hypothetical protein
LVDRIRFRPRFEHVALRRRQPDLGRRGHVEPDRSRVASYVVPWLVTFGVPPISKLQAPYKRVSPETKP